MNLNTFLEHWQITENPFRAEEARHDPVFLRLGEGPTSHPDFEKILGDLRQPSTAVVFGEKGSGKTAIRLQIGNKVLEHNQQAPADRLMLIAYDDLNPVLDHFCASHGVHVRTDDEKEVLKVLRRFRLVDHMDAILHLGVRRVVDGLLGVPVEQRALGPATGDARELKRGDPRARSRMLRLAALYDHGEGTVARMKALRRRIGAGRNWRRIGWLALCWVGWIAPAGVVILSTQVDRSTVSPDILLWLFFVLLGLWGVVLAKTFVWDRWRIGRVAAKIAHELRTVPRSGRSITDALMLLPGSSIPADVLPMRDSEDPRYALLDDFVLCLNVMGFGGIIVVLDRIDEPMAINGVPDRMRAIVWPLLNSKFLQFDRLGVKMLLPIELRHALFRESSAFFQEARLDKQNLIERLTWTGATLYDLCSARLNACRDDSAGPLAITELFEPEVTRQDIVDALDQMHQPRDAFKLLYRCMQEHCSNVTEEQGSWRIPRLVLETVRKQQSDRVQDLYRGLRPG